MRTLHLISCLLLAASACASSAQHHHGHHHSFADAEKWSKIFDDPARDQWQKPEKSVKALRLKKTDLVAEIGAGTGYFIPHLSRAVPRGKVFAIDVEQSLIDHMKSRFKSEGIKNASAVLGAFHDPKIPEPVNLILIVDTYHHIEDRGVYFQELKKSLRPGGRIAIVDFKPQSKMGPKHKFPLEQIQKEMEAAGYRQTENLEFLPEQFFLIYSPS